MANENDLRVIRTKESICKTFEEMICEMDYEKITIKELTECAKIPLEEIIEITTKLICNVIKELDLK